MRLAKLFCASLTVALLATAVPAMEPSAASAATAADSSCRYYYHGRYYRYRWHGGYYNHYWHGRYYRSRYRCVSNGRNVWCYR